VYLTSCDQAAATVIQKWWRRKHPKLSNIFGHSVADTLEKIRDGLVPKSQRITVSKYTSAEERQSILKSKLRNIGRLAAVGKANNFALLEPQKER
jgi:hypothetical protein